MLFLSGNLGTQYLSGRSCKKERRKKENQTVKLLQSAGFQDKLSSGLTIHRFCCGDPGRVKLDQRVISHLNLFFSLFHLSSL